MKTMRVMALTVAAGLLLAPAAFAAVGGGDGGKGKAPKMTEEQKTKLKAIGEEQKKTQTPLWEQLKTQMKDLKALVGAKAPDEKLTAKLAEIRATRETIEANRKRFEGQREAVLTPMQRAKAALKMAKRMREGMDRRGHGDGEDED